MELTPNQGVSKLQVPAEMVGKKIWDSRLTTDLQLTLLMLVRENQIYVNTANLTRFEEGDSLVVVADDEHLVQVQRLNSGGL